MKFELTTNTRIVFGKKLFQIKATTSFGSVKEGDLGGWIEKEANLSQDGNAWVSGNAVVYGGAWVSGNAVVSGDARVYGDAVVYGDARVSGNAWVFEDAEVSGDARVYGNAEVFGDAWVFGDAEVMWFSKVGSENGTLTAMRAKGGGILVSRGCFLGTLAEFESAVAERRGDSQVGDEYRLLIQFIRLRMGEKP